MARLNYPDIGGGGGGTPSLSLPLTKADPNLPAFIATDSNQGMAIRAGTRVFIDNRIVSFDDQTAITVPTHAVGTDYAIWIKPDGTLESTTSFSSPPVAGSLRIGSYHYAGGGPATAFNTGGTGSAQIWVPSITDEAGYRPSCPDVRGMACVTGESNAPLFWMDIYALAQNHLNGTSVAGASFANNTRPPRIPLAYGGDGSTNYGNCNQDTVAEVLAAYGKRMPDFWEFQAAAFGVVEAASLGGSDPVTTQYRAARASKFVIDIAGVVFCWGRMQAGPFAAASWVANTGGRGSRFNQPNASLLGGRWSSGSTAGSRSVFWALSPAASDELVGGRGVADHMGGI